METLCYKQHWAIVVPANVNLHFLQTFLTHSNTMTPLAFENIVGKGEIACTSNFSFSHNVFYSIKDRNCHFCNI